MGDKKGMLTEYEDTRIPCKYGTECYQRNKQHHEKYKHPLPRQPNHTEDDSKQRKRRSSEVDEEFVSTQDHKRKVTDESQSPDICNENDDTHADDNSNGIKIPIDKQQIILETFLVRMPNDFYQFYEFCCSLSPQNPCSALSVVNLELVGPYDVLNGKITCVPDDKTKYLRHWRYFHDVPEFQTILKGDNKDGLHYGYWRDDPGENPVFVAKNSANRDYKIIPLAPDLFSAVRIHIAEKLKSANLFEKSKISQLLQKLTNYSKKYNINLDKTSEKMTLRNKKVVAKTIHGAGIVVPFDPKTQLGYRPLAETDSHLLKLLKQIDEAESDEIRQIYLSKLQEVIRLATIAADECDFGTPLELGHDLFSFGSKYVQQTALRMLKMSYDLLKRPQFSKIAESHVLNRIKGCNLSIL
ncbi:histone PARylation factor 1 [Chelonus insularis]|uniref:histone PARylation factor 1 n=1 Tax=Chelonus insularis TaxID=460826 RepID=UPI00158CE153|nr:histone PARylation factor 1 [Chelonus insularis]